MTQLSFVLIIWSSTKIAKRKTKNSLNRHKCKDKVWQRAGNLTTEWKRWFPTAFTHFPPFSYTTFFFPCTTFDLKPCTELQKKKGYLLTVLLSPWRDKRVSMKCCNYPDRDRSALCSLFKSRHCSWKLSGETSINMAANICICIAQQSLNFITHYGMAG